MKINGLSSLRYSITDIHNEGNVARACIHAGTGLVKFQMSITYRTLIKTHIDQLQSQGASAQVVRNHQTALRGWLESQGKNESSYIGDEFSDAGFVSELARHIGSSKLSQRSLADRRSLLRAWQASYKAQHSDAIVQPRGRVRQRADAPQNTDNAFETLLKEALRRKKLTPKRAARICNISPSALSRWARGGLPNVRSLQSLEKLEKHLELEPGSLKNAWKETLGQQLPVHENAYRQRQPHAQSLRFVLKPLTTSPDLQTEWAGLLSFKTCMKPLRLARRPGAKWSLVDPADTLTKSWHITQVGEQVAPTAAIVWGQVASYLGFLAYPDLGHGLGPEDGFLQTLAWCVVPETMESFLAFIKRRSAGLVHRGQINFCTLVADLTHPVHGYLTQCPELFSRLPATRVLGRDWSTLCAQSHELAKLHKAAAKDKSRNPADTIQFFLEQPHPLLPVLAAMNQLDETARFAPKDSREQLTAKRDRLLLGLLLANPLRAKHWVTLRCSQGSSGDIYRTHEGNWRIRIPGNRFKNRARVRAETYNIAIPERLTPLLDDYSQNVRPKLLGKANDTGEFFLANGGKRFVGFGKRIFSITRRLIPGCGGIGPHAFRHLVATDWLTQNPNDFLTVAELLNDSIDVVIKNYTHLKKDAAFSRYEAYVNEMYAPKKAPWG